MSGTITPAMVLGWSNVVRAQFDGRELIKNDPIEQERRAALIRHLLWEIQGTHGTRGWYMLLAGMVLISIGVWRTWIAETVVELIDPAKGEEHPGLGESMRIFVQAIVDDDGTAARAVFAYEARRQRLLPFMSNMISLLGPQLVDGADVRLPPLEGRRAE